MLPVFFATLKETSDENPRITSMSDYILKDNSLFSITFAIFREVGFVVLQSQSHLPMKWVNHKHSGQGSARLLVELACNKSFNCGISGLSGKYSFIQSRSIGSTQTHIIFAEIVTCTCP